MKTRMLLCLLSAIMMSACAPSSNNKGSDSVAGTEKPFDPNPASEVDKSPLSFAKNGTRVLFNDWAEAFVVGKDKQGFDIIHIRFLQETRRQYLWNHSCGDRFNFSNQQGYKEYFSMNVLAKAGAFNLDNSQSSVSDVDIQSKPYISISSINGWETLDYNSGRGHIEEINDQFIFGQVEAFAKEANIRVSGQFKAYFCGKKASQSAVNSIAKNFKLPLTVPIVGNDGRSGTATIHTYLSNNNAIELELRTPLESAKEFWSTSEIVEYRGGRIITSCYPRAPQIIGELTDKIFSFDYMANGCQIESELRYGPQKFSLSKDANNIFVRATFRQTINYSYTTPLSSNRESYE